jgi:hypothetical protein
MLPAADRTERRCGALEEGRVLHQGGDADDRILDRVQGPAGGDGPLEALYRRGHLVHGALQLGAGLLGRPAHLEAQLPGKQRDEVLGREFALDQEFVQLGGGHADGPGCDLERAWQPLAQLASELLGADLALGDDLLDREQGSLGLLGAQPQGCRCLGYAQEDVPGLLALEAGAPGRRGDPDEAALGCFQRQAETVGLLGDESHRLASLLG